MSQIRSCSSLTASYPVSICVASGSDDFFSFWEFLADVFAPLLIGVISTSGSIGGISSTEFGVYDSKLSINQSNSSSSSSS
uniref:Uncharacterized protein n=1 Tax=Rhizophagus irregularis (strain DAOM 181602 / DAOM 197198 / MUCL 43194) TaxID=747089 RepID=U9T120_RHIID